MNRPVKIPYEKFKRDHRWFLFGGLIALTFCLLAVAWPSRYIWLLVVIWGVFALSDSVLSLLLSMHMRKTGLNGQNKRNGLPYLVISTAGLVAGIGSLFWPDMTSLKLVYIVAGWAFAIAIGRIITRFMFNQDE